MMNPNDIAGKRFEKGMGRTYRSDEVDKFLTQVADDMNDLIADKRESDQKLQVLAGKVEEYKNDEESMRSALIGAQKLGDSVVRNSREEAAAILAEANRQAELVRDQCKRELEAHQNAYTSIQREVSAFKGKLQIQYRQHLELINAITVDEAALRKANELAAGRDGDYDEQPEQGEQPVEEYAQEPEGEYEAEPEPEAEPLTYTEEPEQADPAAEKPSRYGALKFGSDFENSAGRRK